MMNRCQSAKVSSPFSSMDTLHLGFWDLLYTALLRTTGKQFDIPPSSLPDPSPLWLSRRPTTRTSVSPPLLAQLDSASSYFSLNSFVRFSRLYTFSPLPFPSCAKRYLPHPICAPHDLSATELCFCFLAALTTQSGRILGSTDSHECSLNVLYWCFTLMY